ncbi:MAG: hypothetical protein ACE5OP_07380 [Candidatus Glassbacteria bacterium]
MTGFVGAATLVAILLFRDQLPISRSTGRILGFSVLYAGFFFFYGQHTI